MLISGLMGWKLFIDIRRFDMLTINGIPTEKYQDLVIKGDLQVDGAVDFTNHKKVTWENEIVCWENEVVTYTD